MIPNLDWRKHSACRDEDPDLFFPAGHEGSSALQIEHAKAVCRRCPVLDQCRQWAMDTRQSFGVWGGLSERDRATIWRRRGIRLPAEKTPVERTLQTIWAARTVPLDGGHLAFTGYIPVSYAGRTYTPRQIAFELDRGRPPTGPARRTCDRDGCVLPAHLMDQQERDQQNLCGTRSGYRRHLKRGEPVDEACRQANTDADNRLRRTGTSKVLAP
jgi:hypothetical protein